MIDEAVPETSEALTHHSQSLTIQNGNFEYQPTGAETTEQETLAPLITESLNRHQVLVAEMTKSLTPLEADLDPALISKPIETVRTSLGDRDTMKAMTDKFEMFLQDFSPDKGFGGRASPVPAEVSKKLREEAFKKAVANPEIYRDIKPIPFNNALADRPETAQEMVEKLSTNGQKPEDYAHLLAMGRILFQATYHYIEKREQYIKSLGEE